MFTVEYLMANWANKLINAEIGRSNKGPHTYSVESHEWRDEIQWQHKSFWPRDVASFLDRNCESWNESLSVNICLFDFSFQAIEKLTPSLHVILYLAFNALPVVQFSTVCLLMVAGISCLVVTLFNCFCFDISLKQSNLKFYSRKSIKYTAVFPFIKREMAKFEDREREMVLRSENV